MMIGTLRYAAKGKHEEALAWVAWRVKLTFLVLCTAIIVSAVKIILQIIDHRSGLDLLFSISIVLDSLGAFLVQILVRLRPKGLYESPSPMLAGKRG